MYKRLLFILFFYILPVLSGNNEYKAEHISLEEGISNNMIFSIYQDSRGFMWFGTMFGLVRYDGIKYVTYRYDPNDTNSISNDDVISIYEDKEGYLWVGTYFGGLNRLNRNSGKFTRYIHNDSDNNTLSDNTVWAITQDKSGAMWFGTNAGGLNKFSDNKFTSYRSDSLNNKSIGSNTVFALLCDKEGNMWIGTAGGGLNKYDPVMNSFTRFRRDPKDSNSISGNVIRSVYIDHDDIIWAGTLSKGLSSYNKSTGKFTRYNIPAASKDANNQGSSIFSVIPVFGSTNELWVSTGSGLYSLNKSTGIFTYNDIYTGNVSKNQNIVSACMDKSGILWLSTYFEGLHKYYLNMDKFTSYIYDKGSNTGLSGNLVKCFCEDKYNNIWIGTANGLNKFDRISGTFNYFLKDNEPGNISVNSIKCDTSGNLWIGTDNGLFYFDPVKETKQVFINDPKDSNSLSAGGITNILFTRSGEMWIGTNNGLNRYENKRFIKYNNDPHDTNSISDNTVLALYEDKENNIWAGTYAGLNRYNRADDNFIHYRKDLNNPDAISNNYVFSFCEDNSGNFWIGTGGGLNLFNRQTGKFKGYNEASGLENSVICGILRDKKGNLWLSTKKGLSCFDPLTNNFKNYNASDGLQSNMFSEGAYFSSNDDYLYFGGINGFTVFDPGKFIKREFTPPVVLTDLNIFTDNKNKHIDISGTEEITLSYSDNIISIDFASLDYYLPAKNEYSYMLEGFENSWKQPGHVAKAVYTNLDPGTYFFRVKGTNSDGIWSSNEAVLKIIVTPPFWKTWWFYSLILLTVVFAGYFLYKTSVKRKIDKMLELEKAKETERDKIRLETSRDYHDELGHKLTRISIYTRRITKKLGVNSNGITGDLKGIIEVSDSLQSGAKDLIWSLNPDEDTLYDFAVRLKDFGNSIFENTGINFTICGITEEMRNIKLNMKVKRHLIFIFKESMNNTLKYSKCTEAEVSFILNGSQLEICFDDNGIGFDADQTSAGYGLKNIHNRAKQIGANIDINSMPGKGTKIKFDIGL